MRESIDWQALYRIGGITGMNVMEDQKEKFDAFVTKKYIESNSKKATVLRSKLQKIVNCLKNNPCIDGYCPKFKHCVKHRGFTLINYKALGLTDVLYLPARTKVC